MIIDNSKSSPSYSFFNQKSIEVLQSCVYLEYNIMVGKDDQTAKKYKD